MSRPRRTWTYTCDACGHHEHDVEIHTDARLHGHQARNGVVTWHHMTPTEETP